MNIESERSQLVGIWRSAFSRPWATKPYASVTHLCNFEKAKVGDYFRKVHDSFGYMAKGTLHQKGLCSGTIYRSEKFMSLPQAERNGSAGPRRSLVHLQTVHIEHTVPVKVLTDRWKAFRAERAPMLVDVYAWTLVHSVSAGVHMSEKGGLGPYEKKTDAFTAGHAHIGLPFMRYSNHVAPPVIWNVITGQKIDPETWTFKDHVASTEALLSEVGGYQPEVVKLRARMQEMLAILPGGEA